MPLIQGSSTTDPRFADFRPGRPLTKAEMALRESLGGVPMSSATNRNASNYQPTPARVDTPTGNGGGNPTPPQGVAPSNENNGSTDLASAIRQSALDAISRKLETAKQLSRQRIAQAGTLRDETIGANAKYRDRSKQYFEEDASTINSTFEGIKGNARRTADDIETKNRVTARAGGRLNSSVYDSAQAGLNETLGRQMGNINLERTGNDRENTRTLNTRYDAADAADAEARNQYQLGLSAAQALENEGVDNFNLDVTSAEGNFASRLDAIDSVNRQIAALTGKLPTASNMAVNTSGVVNALNGAPTLAMSGTGATPATTGNPVSSPEVAALLEQQRKKALYGYLGIGA
jgi:hypothetical protein